MKTNGNLALEQKKVIVIESVQKPEAQKLRVAAYCRVSSDSSDQMNSFAAQLNYYTTLISGKENWTLTDIYADTGISGTSAEKRPDFQRLLSDCRKGRVDKILVKSISRFARNAVDCLKTIRELKAIGVGVCFEEQGIDTTNMTGELLTAMFSAIAQKESESISGNMRWSYQTRMKKGAFLPAAVSFGYRIENRKIVIDEERAEIVRHIFHDYLAGQSMEEIASWLNQKNITVRIGWENRRWMHNAISYILSNERYIGDSLWQKTYATDTLSARQVKNHGERQQYYAEATHPPIIEKDVFLAVQDLKSRRSEAHSGYKPANSPLQRRITCGICGARYTRKVCLGKRHTGYAGRITAIRTLAPQRSFWRKTAFLRMYHKLRLHGEPILKQMLSDLQAVRERRMLWSLDIIELNKKISDINDQERMLTDMNKCGLVDPDIFISRSNELAQQLLAAKREKESILGAEHDDTILQTWELLETLKTLPEFLPAFDGEIFADLVDSITADSGNTLRFRLKNGLELTETVERSVR